MAISTTIKKDIFEKKMEELKEFRHFYEYKEMSDFWTKRLTKQEYPTDITFLIGSRPEKFIAKQLDIIKFYSLPKWVREFFREQGHPTVKPNSYYGIKCVPPPENHGN